MKRIERKRLLSSLDRPLRLRTVRKTGSTNDDLKAAAKKGAPDYSLLIADRQVGGRGREGRTFFSESGLFMSILLPCSDEAVPYLTHIAAIAVANALSHLTREEARIKWVNDVYVAGKKVCGILTERISCESGSRIVIGIGVNIGAPTKGFPADIAEIAGFVECDKVDLAVHILRNLFSSLDHFDKEEVLRDYRALSFLTGKRILVIKKEGSREAVVLGLSDSLGLEVLYSDDSRETLISGEIHLQLLKSDPS